MKRKIYKILMAIMAVISTALPSLALNDNTHSVKFLVTKFALAMGGVLFFSFLLYLGLSIYNKFFVDEKIKDFQLRNDSLRTPRDIDEAVMMFIAKNKIK